MYSILSIINPLFLKCWCYISSGLRESHVILSFSSRSIHAGLTIPHVLLTEAMIDTL